MGSLPNPNLPVTEERLQEFYQQIKPYLGLKEMPSGDISEIASPKPSVSHGNANPTGTIISFMGNYAPDGYLACDGSIKNIAEYPRLANFFQVQFGSINKFGGDGTTTFKVPDLRGEFLRGTGSNSHTNQGNGSVVGTHQDATVMPYEYVNSSGVNAFRGRLDTNGSILGEKFDSIYRDESHYQATDTGNTPSSTFSGSSAITTRPTNTSILYCIKD